MAEAAGRKQSKFVKSPYCLTIMDTDRKWVVVRIDGKIASVSTDYKALADIAARIAAQKSPAYARICAETVDFDHVWELRRSTAWEDLLLFGTDFQKKVWRKLFGLREEARPPHLISYSDFADLCQNKAGVRAVAHAIGLNPVSVIIPCHLVIPKESIDKIAAIQKRAEATIFKGDDLCMKSILDNNSIDFGEYALGKRLKRELIKMELEQGINP